MKRILAILILSVSLGGCASLQNIQSAFQIGTASIANPVTRDRLNQLESAAIIVFAGLNSWKDACRRELIPVRCRDDIAAVQYYTRQIPPHLSQLRVFVKTNDQINATVVFNNITSLISTVKSQAASSGVQIGS